MADLARSSGGDVVVTKAKAEDAPVIKAMVVAAYSKYIERIGKPPAPMLTDYEEVIKTEDVFVIQTNDTQKVAGSIVLDLHHDPDSVKINNLVVDPAAQGRGYGRILMKYAEDLARAQGVKALTLYTNVKMYENLVLYPRMGFVETERKVESGYERVYYRKELV